ncbi:GNAT family N-acetyltransferase [Planococcus sp. X10-3]|uniref:GNAT family N-acetyltransferase n=1 Tax=Planococcus sp. X10-3 TaxID=3061240 RepID=UPI003BB126EC
MIRNYQPGDEEGINALYQTVFGKSRSLAEWQWKFVEFTEAAPIIIVAEQDGQIVGHAAVLKIPGVSNGRRVQLGERVDIMVHPSHQGQGIYKEIVQAMIEACTAAGIDVLYGFPAEKAKDVFLKTAGGEDLGNVPRFLAVQRPGALIGTKLPAFAKLAKIADKPYGLLTKRKSPYQLRDYAANDSALIDELYHRFAAAYPLHAVRDSAYIQRRYLAHPTRDYMVQMILKEDAAVGYAVCRTEKMENGTTTATIVDLWAQPDAAVLTGILRTIRNTADADAINCWAVGGSARYSALKSAGFRHINSPMPFVIRTFNTELKVSQLADWHLSQSDVDSY